jgi:hypothetical protein
MRVAAPAAKLESHEHMTMLVYVFNSLWVAGELGIIKPTGNLLPFCKLLLQQAQANLKAGAPVRCRHLAAAKSAIIQYGWMLQEMSQADYVKVHRETDKRTVTSVRKLKPRRRS